MKLSAGVELLQHHWDASTAHRTQNTMLPHSTHDKLQKESCRIWFSFGASCGTTFCLCLGESIQIAVNMCTNVQMH